MDTITPYESREKGIIRKYLHNNNQALDLRGGGEYYSAMTRHFSPRIANWMGRSSGQLVAETRGRHTNTNTINFLSSQSYKYTKYWAAVLIFSIFEWLLLFIKMRRKLFHFSTLPNLNLVWAWPPHPTWCGPHMLSVSDVASKISNPGPVWFLPPPPPPRERLFASSKGHYSELSQTWEGSEPIHIRFSPPSHAWEVLKYFLKYLLAARSEDNGFSMALLTQNGKRCRHCEVQTRHSDLDSNESDPGTGHWSQVWLHLHLQLNGHPQIYWMTSTVCCLATKHGQKIRGMERVTEKLPGNSFWIFFSSFFTVDFSILCC